MLKKDLIMLLLEKCEEVLVQTETGEDTIIPEHLKGNSKYCTLLIGYNVYPPIVDLEVTSSEIKGTLTFSSKPFYCIIPFENITGLLGNDTYISFRKQTKPKKPKLKLVQ